MLEFEQWDGYSDFSGGYTWGADEFTGQSTVSGDAGDGGGGGSDVYILPNGDALPAEETRADWDFLGVEEKESVDLFVTSEGEVEQITGESAEETTGVGQLTPTPTPSPTYTVDIDMSTLESLVARIDKRDEEVITHYRNVEKIGIGILSGVFLISGGLVAYGLLRRIFI